MKTLQRGYALATTLVLLALVLVAGTGWVMNIIKLVGMDAIFTGWGVARIVGIFVAPLGAILGFC